MRVHLNELEKKWSFNASSNQKSFFKKLNLKYRLLNQNEMMNALHEFVKILETPMSKSGPKRYLDWEKGWKENLNNFAVSQEVNALIPGYFGKFVTNRWDGNLVIAESHRFEYEMLQFLIRSQVEKYIESHDTLYEFGCGTGHNLIRIRDFLPMHKLIGLDWARSSQNTILRYKEKFNDKNLNAFNFNFFKPNHNFKLEKNSIVITIGALEQTGTDYKNFVKFLILNKVKLVINIEPIQETLDPSGLIDFLTLKYMNKRNYLRGYLTHLQKHSSKIRVIEFWRSGLGSFTNEPYSVVVWKPR